MSHKPFDPSKPVIVAGPPPVAANPARNAMKHGCCAVDTLIMPNESMEDYKALDQIWCRAYNAQNEPERHLIAELVQADWFLQRATRAYNDVEKSLYAVNPSPAEWTEQQERKLGRFLRYRTAHTNTMLKCRKAVEDYRKAKLNEKSIEDKSALAKERFDWQKQKAKPAEPSWKDHLIDMRNQAISLGFTPPDRSNRNPAQR